MTVFFALTAAMTVLILISILAFVWENRFTSYTRENLQNTANITALNMSQEYAHRGDFDVHVLDIATKASAANPDIGIQV